MTCNLVDRNVNFYHESGRRERIPDSHLVGLRRLINNIRELSSYAIIESPGEVKNTIEILVDIYCANIG